MTNKSFFLNSRFTGFEMELLEKLSRVEHRKKSEILRELVRVEARKLGFFYNPADALRIDNPTEERSRK